jgi:hypothetical protein
MQLHCTIVLLLVAFGPLAARAEDKVNSLTEEEKRAGWQLLFDGRTTRGWMSPKGKPLPQSHVQDGALNHPP